MTPQWKLNQNVKKKNPNIWLILHVAWERGGHFLATICLPFGPFLVRWLLTLDEIHSWAAATDVQKLRAERI